MSKPKWRRILYEKQPYPDNYTDATFLNLLRKNVNVRRYTLSHLCFQASVTILLHLNKIILFVFTLLKIESDVWQPNLVLNFAFIFTIIAYFFWYLSMRKAHKETYIDPTVKSGLLIIVVIFGLSPLLKTLTSDVSVDSIWFLATLAFTINAIWHDYSSENCMDIVFPGTISINAAIFGSVLLASRNTNSTLKVASILSISIVTFALFPAAERHLRHFSPKTCLCLSIILLSTTLYLIKEWSNSYYWISFYCFVVILIILVFPAGMIYSLKYKNAISGPWDEAKPAIGNDLK
ncbi:GPI2-domain-containing protein [Neoconidiobolus thromboides FSU 785]|nr:GPI2-domain-containing protein [Neoconidiobolus thromboides FSU 785]